MIAVLTSKDSSLAGYPLARLKKVYKTFSKAEKALCVLDFMALPLLRGDEIPAVEEHLAFYRKRLREERLKLVRSLREKLPKLQAAAKKAIVVLSSSLCNYRKELAVLKERAARNETREALVLSWSLPNGRKGRVSQLAAVAA